jgi:hypothetical protein
MHAIVRGLLLSCAAVAFAQAPAPQPPAGLIASWEIAPVLQEISAHAGRVLPELDKLNAEAWVAQGASDTYSRQLESSKQQARAIVDAAKALAQNPEKLSASLELLFRIQALESMIGSLSEAVRKYQTPADAQALVGLSAENGANRERFQAYIVNLAAEREQDLIVMDREAQRCRALVTQTPPAKTGRKR